MSRDEEFAAFVERRRPVLVRTAIALTGDGHLAEDLVQTALVRLYLSWGRARRTTIDAYARRTLVSCLVDESRRPHRRECTVDQVPDTADPRRPGRSDGPDDELLTALAELPVGMRTAVVLRHVEGLDVAETAHAMGCSTGNVKSQTARGLERLRARLDTPDSQGAPR